MLSKEQFCCQQTDQLQLPLYGTAPYYQRLVLVELAEPYNKNAFADSSLPNEVQACIQALAGAGGTKNKVLLVKNKRSAAELACRVWVADAGQPHLLCYSFEVLTDMLQANAFDAQAAQHTNTPIYLVCTNGKRDKCCAKFGLPIYEQLCNLAGEAVVFESSHFGGHRLAPTLIALPQHACYGNLRITDLPHLVAAVNANELYLPCLRGNCRLPATAQAAEYWVRWQYRLPAVSQLLLHSATPHPPKDAEAATEHFVFLQPHTMQSYEVGIGLQQSEYALYGSCNKAEPQPVTLYQLSYLRRLAVAEPV